MGQCSITRRGLDTSDATATVADIMPGKTAYVNGEKLTGESTAINTVSATYSLSASSNGEIDAPIIIGKSNVILVKITTYRIAVEGYRIVTGKYLNNGAVNQANWVNPTSSAAYFETTTLTVNFTTGKISCSGRYFSGQYFVMAW